MVANHPVLARTSVYWAYFLCPIHDLPCLVSWLLTTDTTAAVLNADHVRMITDTCLHPVSYKLSKSEIVNITVWGRLWNPLTAGRSRLTASGAHVNTNSVRVLTSVNQFWQIQTMWLFFMNLTTSHARKHEKWLIRKTVFHYCNVVK